MVKTIYANLEDDVAKVLAKIKRENAPEVVLVFPKQSFIFSDSINLRLLKKQIDMLGKKAYILTMDEKGQMYAKEAGFELKFLPKTGPSRGVSDIRPRVMPRVPETVHPEPVPERKPAEIEHRPVSQRIVVPPIVPSPRPAPRTVDEVYKAPDISTVTAYPRPEKVEATENVFVAPDSETLTVPKRRSYKKYAIGFIAVSLIVALVLALVVLPSATVTVYAKSQTVARDIDILADVSAQEIDSAKLTIPAVAVNESKSVSNTFQTIGKKEVGSKAQGRVAIYNLTGAPINLRANTTVLTVGSKNYAFTADVNGAKALPNANSDNGATVADVVAQEGGESFNLPAGTRMEISNQVFGNQPQRLFAKTVTQVIGGSSRFVSVITKDDITKAQEDFKNAAVKDINEDLAGKGMKLVEGAYTMNMTSFTTDKPEGTESPTFSAQAQLSFTGLAIDESSLKEMVRQRLMMSLGDSKTLQPLETDKVKYKIKNIDTANGVMQLTLHYESKAVPAIEKEKVKAEIAGKSSVEASEVILSNSDVDRVEITVFPSWQQTLPRFGGKIRLEIKE